MPCGVVMLASLRASAIPPESLTLIAAAGDSAQSPTSLVQYGVLGIIVAALGPFAYVAYKREAARADRLEVRLDEMHRANTEKIIPALLSATEVIRDTEQLVRDIARRNP